MFGLEVVPLQEKILGTHVKMVPELNSSNAIEANEQPQTTNY